MVKNSKTLKTVVCMSLIVALALSALGLSVRAVYENTHYNSGDQASDIVGVATSQVGYSEGDSGYTKYGDWYGLPYSDWCAMFVSWCADQAGVSNDAFPRFALCSAGADWFIQEGRFHYAGSYAPQAGDLIFYASYGDIYHVGLVTGSDGSNVYSIEGNYNEAVYNVSYPLGYGDIMGYATPAYKTNAPAAQPDTKAVESTEEEVKEESDTEAYVVRYDDEETIDFIDDDEEEVSSVPEENEDTDEDVKTSDIDTESETESEIEENTTDTSYKEDDVDSEKTTDEDKTSSKMGDVDGDNSVDSADSVLIQFYLSGQMEDDTSFSYLNADVDGSGDIGIADALLVLLISVGAA